MRYAEIQRLYNHPEWYSESRNQIRLNEEAQKKAKRKAKERTIDFLPSTLPYILDQFLSEPAPPYLYHYQGLSFMDPEIDQIKKRLMEWEY